MKNTLYTLLAVILISAVSALVMGDLEGLTHDYMSRFSLISSILGLIAAVSLLVNGLKRRSLQKMDKQKKSSSKSKRDHDDDDDDDDDHNDTDNDSADNNDD